jgi:spermidine/putrescine transport system substrate-binding protein
MTDVDPDVVRSLRRLLSRRSVLRGAAAAGALAAGGALLAACEGKGADNAARPQAAVDRSDTDKVVNFSNWPLYIDVDPKNQDRHPTLDEFAAQTGIKVSYLEDINDNDQFFGRIRGDLSAGRDIKRDVIVLTDWMAARLIRLKWVQKLDLANIPNHTTIQPLLTEVAFDPDRMNAPYSMPWAGIMAGIAYNKKVVSKPVTTVGELFARPDLKGRVTALTEMHDTIGLTLLDNGVDPGNVTDPQFDEAIATLEGAVKSGQIRRFTGNDYVQDLASGNIAACIAWSGDIVQLQAENPDIEFVIPDAGGTRSNDNMMVPNQAQHKRNAEKLINYYYDPKVAAKLAAYVNYICPVVGAQAELEKTDPKTANNPLIFPSDLQLSNLHSFKALDDDTEQSYNSKFQKVIGA